jgi:hypothetical protein
MVVLLLYFLCLTQGRSAIEGGQGPTVMIAVHIAFGVLALTLLQWERITKRWKAASRA